MKHWVWLLWGVAACQLPGKDGDTCRGGDDCDSGECLGNVCIGSDCSDDGDCPSNFDCYYYDGDPIFGLGDGRRCRLTCEGGCPAQWSCYEEYCHFVGPMISVTVTPEEPRAHEVVTFSMTIDPDIATEVTWDFYELGMQSGREVQMTFGPGNWSWHLIVDTHDGRQYEQGYVNACAVAGDACNRFDGCCEGFTCSASNVCE